mgnify:CR=1 FL=1
MKIRTLDQLLGFIEDERVWRIREISMLKGNCVKPELSERQREVQRRAFIPLAYAHWEGFAKGVGQAYLDHVAAQQLKLSELSPCFQSVYFSIENEGDLRRHKRHNMLNILDRLHNHGSDRVHIRTKDVISTQGNLNSDALFDICTNLGVSFEAFSDSLSFIDKILLGKRNRIAHGEHIFVSDENIDEISSKVVTCIDCFRNEIENAATTEAFRNAM